MDLTLRSDKIADIPRNLNPSRIFFGKGALSDINEDVIFLSPSVRRDRHELLEAVGCGTLLSSDAELFFSLFQGDVFCVTGSDGKSTATYLISDILKRSGFDSVPAGNYGRSLSELIGSDIIPVAELSSFQLSYLKPKSRRAVITNITPNHLNWHSSFEEYVNAKKNILPYAKEAVIDCGCEISRHAIQGRKAFAAISAIEDFCSVRQSVCAENYLTLDNSAILLNGKPYIDISGAKRREWYNTKNFMLAIGATLDAADKKAQLSAINEFSGLPHRAETVICIDGIKYIDSSIDSSPERTIKTLSSLCGKTAVIIGGLGKGLSLLSLARELPRLTVGAVLCGEVGASLAEILKKENSEYQFTTADDMEAAVQKAEAMLSCGGNLILSPAATSFDKYENFAERGDDIKRIVLGKKKK